LDRPLQRRDRFGFFGHIMFRDNQDLCSATISDTSISCTAFLPNLPSSPKPP